MSTLFVGVSSSEALIQKTPQVGLVESEMGRLGWWHWGCDWLVLGLSLQRCKVLSGTGLTVCLRKHESLQQRHLDEDPILAGPSFQ